MHEPGTPKTEPLDLAILYRIVQAVRFHKYQSGEKWDEATWCVVFHHYSHLGDIDSIAKQVLVLLRDDENRVRNWQERPYRKVPEEQRAWMHPTMPDDSRQKRRFLDPSAPQRGDPAVECYFRMAEELGERDP